VRETLVTGLTMIASYHPEYCFSHWLANFRIRAHILGMRKSLQPCASWLFWQPDRATVRASNVRFAKELTLMIVRG